MMEIQPFIVAAVIVILAGILWKFVFKLPFIMGYGLGQREGNSLETLFKEHQEAVPSPQREVVHLCGRMNNLIWKQESWIKWLNDLKEKKITARVIAGPEIDKESQEIIKEMIENGVITLRILTNREETHFLIIDEDWAHIEEKHIGREVPSGVCVKHLFPGIRKGLINKFELLWSEAKQATSENIEKNFSS